MPDLSFPSTRWTVILASRSVTEDERHRVTGELCRDYWRPVYSFIRAMGRPPADAEDLTQAFFAQALANSLFERADPDRGRLRSLLLKAVRHHLASENHKGRALKRGGDALHLSLDAAREEDSRCWAIEPAAQTLGPDMAFDRRWAECLLETVLGRLRDEHQSAGKSAHYEALRPLLSGDEEAGSAEAARLLRLEKGALRIALHRFRRRYRALIREEIQRTLAPGSDVEEELAYLVEILRQARNA